MNLRLGVAIGSSSQAALLTPGNARSAQTAAQRDALSRGSPSLNAL